MQHIIASLSGQPLAVLPSYAESIWSVVSARAGQPYAAAGDFTARQPTPVNADGVAHISVIGSLTHRGSAMDAQSGMISYRTIGDQIDAAIADPAVKSILLEIDSPGGSVSGAFDLADKIRAAKAIKPVTAFVDGMAASAAYLLASQCTQIIATQTSQIGSIGVVTMHIDRSGELALAGVRPTFIYAGAQKVDGNSANPLPADVKDRLQASVDGSYKMFVDAVGAGRGSRFTSAAARKTEAGIFDAAIAKSMGMIDQIGTMRDAMADAAPAPAARVVTGGFLSPAAATPAPAPKQPSAKALAYAAAIDRHIEATNVARSRNGKPPITKADLSQKTLSSLLDDVVPDAQGGPLPAGVVDQSVLAAVRGRWGA